MVKEHLAEAERLHKQLLGIKALQMEPWQPAPVIISGSRNRMIEKVNEDLEEN